MAKLILGAVLKKMGISKRQFAKRIGCHYNNVWRYFRPGYDPKLSTLSLWAKSLGCRVRDLIKE